MNAIRNCRFCGSALPPEHAGRGKQKQFCSDNCRVKLGYRRKFGVTTNRQRRERRRTTPYVVPQLSEPQKAWLAAMVDAEGWLGIVWTVKRGRTTGCAHIFVCVLANTNRKLIARAVELLGESNTYHRTKRVRARFKTLYDVYVHRDAVLDFLGAIIPYLIAKRRQAELVMEYCRTHDDLPVRTTPLDRFEEIAKECKALNRRGV